MNSGTALSCQFIEGLLLGGGIVLLIWAALHDLAARTVPNGLPVAVALAGFGLRALDHSLMAGLAAAGASFAILFALWSARAIGGGDVKLWSASVLLIPAHWQAELDCLTRILLVGGALGLLYLLLRPALMRWCARARSSAPRANIPRANIPGANIPGANIPGANIPGANIPGAGLFSRILRAEAWRIARKAPLPYALAIAGGTILTLLPSFPPSALVALR